MLAHLYKEPHSMVDEPVVDETTFPVIDKKAGLCIDKTLPAVTGGNVEYRVYHWAVRPDADQHTDDDKEHWALDSIHDTIEKAQARVTTLKGGAKALRLSDEPHMAAIQRKVN
jgi:hypothetical protein